MRSRQVQLRPLRDDKVRHHTVYLARVGPLVLDRLVEELGVNSARGADGAPDHSAQVGLVVIGKLLRAFGHRDVQGKRGDFRLLSLSREVDPLEVLANRIALAVRAGQVVPVQPEENAVLCVVGQGVRALKRHLKLEVGPSQVRGGGVGDQNAGRGQKDGRTDGRTDSRTDGQTDGTGFGLFLC